MSFTQGVSKPVLDDEKSIGLRDSLASSNSSKTTHVSVPEMTFYPKTCEKQFQYLPAASVHYTSTYQLTQPNESEEPWISKPSLPMKVSFKCYRNVRWLVYTTYARLWSLAIFVNSIILSLLLCNTSWRDSALSLSGTATATSVNITISVLLRQEHMVNLLFLISCAVPISAPLRMRRWAAKIYCYGGLHSGCALAATGWFAAFCGFVIKQLIHDPLVDPAMTTAAFALIVLLATMCISSLPQIRSKYHNSFEMIHRLCGWSAVILFWVLTFLLVRYQSTVAKTPFRDEVIKSISVWCLLVTTASILLPWLRLRRLSVRPEVLSPHAIRLHFDNARPNFGQGFRLSDRPLIENHAFAAIPDPDEGYGFSVIVSNAGDWTNRIINNPPATLWTRGVLQYGAIRVATLFKSVLVVATGSGIAPCLSLFNGAPDLHCRVLWSAPRPLATYGRSVLDLVLAKDRDANIIDTKKSGRPDLVRNAYWMYKSMAAEAVIIISNAKVTKKIVYGLETRGVPAFAPIFDS